MLSFIHNKKIPSKFLFFALALWLLFSCLSYLSTLQLHNDKRNVPNPVKMGGTTIPPYSKWPSFSFSSEKVDYGCLNLSLPEANIEKFVWELENLRESNKFGCERFLEDFDLIYEVTHQYSRPVHFPKALKQKIEQSFNDSKLSDRLNHQNLIHVFNQLTFEHNIYNPLRASRPKPPVKEDIWVYVDRVSNETRKQCDMCEYLQHTAVDEFGRHQTADTVRVSNAFKIERWHGMVITRHSHHPTNFTMKEIVMLFKDATDWAAEIQVKEGSYIYCHLSWDVLFKAGASQIHPHLHLVLSPNHYYGQVEKLRSVGETFFRATGENYFSKLTEIYSHLGLSFQYRSAIALATLAGQGELEIMLMSEKPSADLYVLLYFVIKTYHEMRLPCHSAGMAWSLEDDTDSASEGLMPVTIRIMSRGDCLSLQNDVSSLNFYLANYRAYDPWNFIGLLKQIVPKYESEANSLLQQV